MILEYVIKYALEKALDIVEWEKYSLNSFAFNGVPKNNRFIKRVIIYQDYKEIWIYTKENISYSIFRNLEAFSPFVVNPGTYNPDKEEEKLRINVPEEDKDGLLIRIRWV